MATNRLIIPRSLIDWTPPCPELVKALSLPLADMDAAEPDQLGGHAAAHCLPWSGMPMPISKDLCVFPATGGGRGGRPAALLLPGASGRAWTGSNPATSSATCSRGAFTPWSDSGAQLEAGYFRGLLNTSLRPPTSDETSRLAQEARGAFGVLGTVRNSFEQLPAAEQSSPTGWPVRVGWTK